MSTKMTTSTKMTMSTKMTTSMMTTIIAVSPALIFIQHAGAEDYDPTLCFGRTPILNIEPYSQRFNELLNQTVSDIFSPDVPYTPCNDQKICMNCPYAKICSR